MKDGDLINWMSDIVRKFQSEVHIDRKDIVLYIPAYFKKLLEEDICKTRFENLIPTDSTTGITHFKGIPIINGYDHKIVICHKEDSPVFTNLKHEHPLQ